MTRLELAEQVFLRMLDSDRIEQCLTEVEGLQGQQLDLKGVGAVIGGLALDLADGFLEVVQAEQELKHPTAQDPGHVPLEPAIAPRSSAR